MNTAEQSAPVSVALLDDPLAQMQLRVARRADELARGIDFSRVKDMLIWFQAERDVLGASNADRPMSMMQPAGVAV